MDQSQALLVGHKTEVLGWMDWEIGWPGGYVVENMAKERLTKSFILKLSGLRDGD